MRQQVADGFLRQPVDETDELLRVLRLLGEKWLFIATVVGCAVVATALVTSLLMTKWYRANAVVRPISTSGVENRLTGLIGGLGEGFGKLGGLAGMAGGGANDAQEYIAILKSFRFNVNLADAHDLEGALLTPSSGALGSILASKPGDRNWEIFRTLNSRFDCDYSPQSGNVTLHFEARNRTDAENILAYYIDDLRSFLRARNIRDTTSAIDSLEEEAASTPDNMLRTQLYELVAKQIEQRKIAQVEADFAFRVLDPPAASDKPYRPRVIIDCVTAGLVAFFMAVVIVAGRGRLTDAKERIQPSIRGDSAIADRS